RTGEIVGWAKVNCRRVAETQACQKAPEETTTQLTEHSHSDWGTGGHLACRAERDRQDACASMQSARRLGSRSLKHQLPHVFHGRTAVRDHLIVIFLEIEITAESLLFCSAQIEVLGRADEIGGELSGSKPGAFPFGDRFALLLVTFFGHQIH